MTSPTCRVGSMFRAWNRRRSSLTLIGIRLSGVVVLAAPRRLGERVGGDDEGGPAVPGSPAAVLVLVRAEAGFG